MQTQIKTSRLLLGSWTYADSADVLRIFSSPAVAEWTGARPFVCLVDAVDWITASVGYEHEHGVCEWAVAAHSASTVIGACGLGYFDDQEELGLAYHFDPSYSGRGYATEAAAACSTRGTSCVHRESWR